MIPILLYITMEIVKLKQAYFIKNDAAMYGPVSDMPAHANTTTNNEELRQVSYVFTDKTGTLTENMMLFQKCTITGLSYNHKIPVLTLTFCHMAILYLKPFSNEITYQSASLDEMALVAAAADFGFRV